MPVLHRFLNDNVLSVRRLVTFFNIVLHNFMFLSKKFSDGIVNVHAMFMEKTFHLNVDQMVSNNLFLQCFQNFLGQLNFKIETGRE